MTNKAIERKIQKIFKDVYAKVFTKSTVQKLLSANTALSTKKTVKEMLEQLVDSKQYEKFCKAFAAKLAKSGLSKEKGVWRKYFEAAKAKHIVGLPATFSEYEKDMFAKIAKKNFIMIKSIPAKIFKIYEEKSVQTLIAEVLQGAKARGSFEKLLKAKGSTNAKVIARTETAKLQAGVREERARALGSVAYRWLSSNDKRTRRSHKDMNNVVVFYRPDNEKPLLDKMRGNAGEFPNCRCTSITIFDEYDLPNPSYFVYDYRTDKKVKMSKKDILEAIKNGHL